MACGGPLPRWPCHSAGLAHTFPWGAADVTLGRFFPVQIPVQVAARSAYLVTSLGHVV